MVHISRDNNIILSKISLLSFFFLAAIKIKWLKYCFRAGAEREKALSLGQSVRSSASTVRYPHEGRPKFLTCQKFIRPSDCLSGETYPERERDFIERGHGQHELLNLLEFLALNMR